LGILSPQAIEGFAALRLYSAEQPRQALLQPFRNLFDIHQGHIPDAALVSNQMLQHYSHIRFQAKQAAIRGLEEQAIEPVFPGHGQRIEQSGENTEVETNAKSLETKVGPVGFEPTTNGL
jgi:hypothetical protein